METVELRVHGVHGTSPGAMLGVPDAEVGQVAGDGLTGIYRATGKLPYRELDGTQVSVEAYSWGNLTSGVQGFLGWVQRVLWLLLLPFALVNLAYWARMDLGGDIGQTRWGARAVRVSGVLLTCFFVLAPCVIAIDIVAWQCYRYGTSSCSRIPGALSFLGDASPSGRVAVSSVVPMLVVALLWVLSRQSLGRYESVVDPQDRPPTLTAFGMRQPVLLHDKLWDGRARTQRLQRHHLAAAVAMVVVFTGSHMLHAADGGPWELWVTVILAGVVLVAAVSAVSVNHSDDVENLPPAASSSAFIGRLETFGYRWGQRIRTWPTSLDQGVLAFAVTVYAVQTLVLATYHGEVDQAQDFYGHNMWFIGLFVVLTALHLAVFTGARLPVRYTLGLVIGPIVVMSLAGAWLFAHDEFSHGSTLWWAFGVAGLFWVLLTQWHYLFSPREPDKAWRGAGASVILAAASWIALLFTSSAVISAANWLNGPDQGVSDLVSTVNESGAGDLKIVVPQVLVWVPMGLLLWLVLVVVALAACIGLFVVSVPRDLAGLFAHPPDDQVPPRDRGAAFAARTKAALIHRAEPLLDIAGAITAPIALGVIVFSMTGEAPWARPGGEWTRGLANVSMYLVVLGSAGLVLLGSQIRRSEKTRKAVGIIWDLTTFWPRAAHPLAPPCYAERVIPELHTRVRWALDKHPDNLVVISGHSQGSLIVASMVSRLNDPHLARLRVVTYGSQVRALYGRTFPGVFGAEVVGYRPTTGPPSLRHAFPDGPRAGTPGPDPAQPGSIRGRLEAAGGTWVNLFRRSDPLGFRVFSDSDSHLDLPVMEVPPASMGDPGPAVMGHSGYQHTPIYRRQVCDWTGEAYVPDPPGTKGLPALPPR